MHNPININSLNKLDIYLKKNNRESDLNDEENEIISKYQFLHANGLSHLKSSDIEKWLNNFESKPSHKFMALYILQSITYRNYDMMDSAFIRKIGKDIKNIYENISGTKIDSIEEWLGLIKKDINNTVASTIKIKFYSIDKKSGSVTQSSNVILRSLANNVVHHSRVLNDVEAVKNSIEEGNIVVFIDDFLGSGQQASDFFHDNGFCDLVNESTPNTRLIYMPMMAMREGLEKLKEDFPSLTILPCELIEENCQLSNHYSLDSYLKVFDLNHNELAMTQIFQEMRQSYSFIGKPAWSGRNKAMLSIVFSWGCPNQTVSIIYHDNHVPISTDLGRTGFLNPLTARRRV